MFDDAAPLRRGPVDRRGLPRRARARADHRDTRPRSQCGSDEDVREIVGLPITVGVARTKFLAKVASGVAKPDGLLVVAARRGARVPASAAGGTSLGCRPEDGVHASTPAASARSGTSLTARRRRSWQCSVEPPAATSTRSRTIEMRGRCSPGGGDARSAPSGRSAARSRSIAEIDATLVGLVDRVTRRLRAAHRVGRTVVLRLRFADFSRATRSTTLPPATAETQAILVAARVLLAAARPAIEQKG